jgi:hypothetical protein
VADADRGICARGGDAHPGAADPDEADRQKAIDLVLDVAGPLEEMSPPTIAMLKQLQFLLNVRASQWQASEYDVKPLQAQTAVASKAAE